MADEPKFKTPPYLAYRTFTTFVDSMKTSGIPSRIDRSLLRSMSGTAQSQLMSALAFFGFIDDAAAGNTTPALKTFVEATADDRKVLIKDLVTAAFPYLFNNGVNLTNSTPKQVEDVLREQTGISGDTVRKCFVFFVAMAKDGGIPLSSFLSGTRAKNGSSRRRQGARAAATPDFEEPEDDVAEEDEGNVISVPENFTVHTFKLRRDLDIQLALPSDITSKDVARLYKLMQVLPLEDDDVAS